MNALTPTRIPHRMSVARGGTAARQSHVGLSDARYDKDEDEEDMEIEENEAAYEKMNADVQVESIGVATCISDQDMLFHGSLKSKFAITPITLENESLPLKKIRTFKSYGKEEIEIFLFEGTTRDWEKKGHGKAKWKILISDLRKNKEVSIDVCVEVDESKSILIYALVAGKRIDAISV